MWRQKEEGKPGFATIVSANNTPEDRLVKPTLTTPPKDDIPITGGRVNGLEHGAVAVVAVLQYNLRLRSSLKLPRHRR